MSAESVRKSMRSNRTGNRLEAQFEMLLSSINGIEFQADDLPGSPDAVHRRKKMAVFLHGCFWHACKAHGTLPRSNRAFWQAKFARNARRDAKASRALRSASWRVLTLWEHDLKAGRVARILEALGR